MQPSNALHQIRKSPFAIVDPGDAGYIYIDRNWLYCPIVTKTAETRILDGPPKAGLTARLGMTTDAGDCVVTVKDSAGATTGTTTFDDAADWAEYISIETSPGVFAWRCLATYGTVNTVPTPSAISGVVVTKMVPFIENAVNTVHTGTVPIPAGATLLNIQVVNTVLWGATSAALDVGDDDDANGYFAAVNCKATDLLIGEVLDISNAENWGGKNGDYLVAATGRKGCAAGGIYYAAANNIIGVMTVGTPAAATGRTFMAVTYCVPDSIAAVATGP